MRIGFSLYVSAAISADPFDTRSIARRRCAINSRLAGLPAMCWCVIFWRRSPERALHSAMAEIAVDPRSLIEHEALMSEARRAECCGGPDWLKLFRSEQTLANAARDLDRARHYGVDGESFDGQAIAARERI